MGTIRTVVYARDGKLRRATSSLSFALDVEIQILNFLRKRAQKGGF